MLPRLHRMSHKKIYIFLFIKFINFVFRKVLYNALYSKRSKKIETSFLILAHKRVNTSQINSCIKSHVIGEYVFATCNVHFYFCQKSRLKSSIFRVEFPSDPFYTLKNTIHISLCKSNVRGMSFFM